MTASRARPDVMLKPGEVASRFGVAPYTVARWAREGVLPAQRTPGGHRRFRESDVVALLDAVQRKQAQTEENPSGVSDSVRGVVPAGRSGGAGHD
jgi:excisionase family DNA binding protein